MAGPAPAAAGELLSIEPVELRFPSVELKKQISCSMQLSNPSNDYIAFKVKTTSPKKYSVRPNLGVVLPRSTCDVLVTMQAQQEPPRDMQCKDKFLVQSVVAPAAITVKDVTADMALRERIEPQEKSLEAGALISKLTEEKNSAIQQNHRLRQELDAVRREVSKRHGGGFSFLVVIIVGLIGILLGYLMRS
nr:unnamed protein product [Digitaria exilis]